MKKLITFCAVVLLVLAIPGFGVPIASWTQVVDTQVRAGESFQWYIGYLDNNYNYQDPLSLFFGGPTFTTADVGKTFTATASAYPGGTTWDFMVANLTDGTNGMLGFHCVPLGTGSATSGHARESYLFYGYYSGVPVDLAGKGPITAINLTFDSFTVRSGVNPEGYLGVGYTVDVVPVPAPGAVLLGGIGVSLVGWLKRRRAL